MSRKRFYLVSNSSSSSFIVPLHRLSGDQIDKILNHKELNDLNDNDQWNVYIEGHKLVGSCFMDNFSMRSYMEEIGVDIDKVNFEYS